MHDSIYVCEKEKERQRRAHFALCERIVERPGRCILPRLTALPGLKNAAGKTRCSVARYAGDRRAS